MTGEGWTEESSLVYQGLSRVAVPRRAEQMATMLSLLPIAPGDDFALVELGCGEGFLSAALLEAYPSLRVIALDGSAEMRTTASGRLHRFGDRAEIRDFDLRSSDWLPVLEGAGAVLSSLVIHHLDGAEKRRLFKAVREHISPSGALLISDIVHPPRPEMNSMMAGSYDEAVKARSVELTGSLHLWDRFEAEDWNHFRTPDPDVDKPSVLSDQLRWLSESGFEVVDCFWMFAGHALYGGYGAPVGSEAPIGYERALEVVHGILGE